MFDPKTTKIVKIRKTNIGGFLAMIFCTIVIVSTIGSSFGIRNSLAQTQQQLQTQQAPTIAYSSPWTNNLPTINANSNNLQILCGHGVCDQSFDPGSRTHDNAVLSSAWTNNLPTINHEEMKSILD